MKKDVYPAITPPEYFRASTYDVCQNWGLKEWTSALGMRNRLRKHWRLACHSGKSEVISRKMIAAVKISARNLVRNPTVIDYDITSISLDSPIEDQSALDAFSEDILLTDPRYSRWADRYALWTNYESHPEGSYSEIAAPAIEKQIINEWQMLESTPAWKMHRDATELPCRFLVSVNLGTSDEFLEKEFKAWINKTRSESGIALMARKFDEGDFSKWHEQRLLPFIDLSFWAEIQHRRITHASMAEAFCKTENGGDSGEIAEEKICNTIQKNANKIVDDQLVSALLIQLRSTPKRAKFYKNLEPKKQSRQKN